MRDRFIINVCLTGMLPTRSVNPHVPVTPEQIAADVKACVELGASIVHLHARDAQEEPEWRREEYQKILDAVRRVSPDVIICVTTSGRRTTDPKQRTDCLDCSPRPEMASLTLGSVNFLHDVTLNSPETVEDLARAMNEREVKPELEIFDVGMARTAARLSASGVLSTPLYVNILLGNAGSADASPLDLAAILHHLPAGAIWTVGGIGRAQLIANTLGILFGHGVRVGLEDNIYFDGDRTPASNAMLVERIVTLGRLLGKRPTTIEETRRMLGM